MGSFMGNYSTLSCDTPACGAWRSSLPANVERDAEASLLFTAVRLASHGCACFRTDALGAVCASRSASWPLLPCNVICRSCTICSSLCAQLYSQRWVHAYMYSMKLDLSVHQAGRMGSMHVCEAMLTIANCSLIKQAFVFMPKALRA